MLSRANLRIAALLGFSSALHAAALLAYGYLYPAAPQAVVAAPIIQLQLQSGLVPELPHQTASRAPDQDALTAAAARSPVVVTNSLEARLIPQAPVVAVAPLSPSNFAPASERPSALPVAMAQDRTPDAEPEQRAVRLESGAKAGSMLEARVSTPSLKPEEVVEAIPSEESVPDNTPVAALAADLSAPEPRATVDSSAAESSRAGSAGQQPSSAQLAEARGQLGEQLLQALDAYFSYPLKARLKGWQGEVRLRVDIGRNGEVGAIRLASSSGYGVLDRAALKSMNQVAEIDLARLALAMTGQSLQVEIPVAYRLVN